MARAGGQPSHVHVARAAGQVGWRPPLLRASRQQAAQDGLGAHARRRERGGLPLDDGVRYLTDAPRPAGRRRRGHGASARAPRVDRPPLDRQPPDDERLATTAPAITPYSSPSTDRSTTTPTRPSPTASPVLSSVLPASGPRAGGTHVVLSAPTSIAARTTSAACAPPGLTALGLGDLAQYMSDGCTWAPPPPTGPGRRALRRDRSASSVACFAPNTSEVPTPSCSSSPSTGRTSRATA